MKELNQYLTILETRISFYEKENLSISKSNVGWHIDHSLKVLIGIINILKNSNPEEYKWKFNKSRLFVYTLGFIPRGKGKAPKSVQSFEAIDLNDLNSQLETTKKIISELNSLDKNANFNHPYFGVLNLKQSIYFLKLHTKHHLKIIDDILKK
ncbi:DUF1569 domain-containing protein [Flavobacterium capsici]|uniref:DUF1569 domain-containing protein n=1 Tax=Flavobacterium capsici TaxID=3075618 RepID=A0AA96J200_9FLAO|nr:MULTISPECIES: DUF1569 domain-containing protein [unclassified Flavobacterium]WNM18957.1 DUF1569 domain-containing protein [Flavobacterium sp. PMR2A8]WNM23007.1 DUF1569 domain-containing protein [Flavobacterium sp. PMTSA4]